MNAGTDSNVTLSIYGDRSALQSILLDSKISPSLNNKKSNLFEKGSTDVFELEGNDVGKVYKLELIKYIPIKHRFLAHCIIF